ncbi:MAG: three-Cys-motif partner protein TcmP [Gammaproteobacteria bacterium]|nr:three-Cys-motif partner protein TcmP [Gammaproteobacteria bacterium]
MLKPDAFTTASKSVTERLYFDLFAGQAENVDRVTREPWKARIALSAGDPPFTRLRFFEIENGKELEEGLRAGFPNRDLVVYSGDCNETIHQALADLSGRNWAPAFAFIDPNGHDIRWSTPEALSAFKASRKHRVELWTLFPEPMFVRLLRVDGEEVRPQDIERILSMFGSDAWRAIYKARIREVLEPSRARIEYVNLMRWRLEKELGYHRTQPFEVHNEQGRPIYHLIFATDHEAGDRIMSHLYSSALREFPKMCRHAVDQRKGALRPFDGEMVGEERFWEAPAIDGRSGERIAGEMLHTWSSIRDIPDAVTDPHRTHLAEKRCESLNVDKWHNSCSEGMSGSCRKSRKPRRSPSHGTVWFRTVSWEGPSMLGRGDDAMPEVRRRSCCEVGPGPSVMPREAGNRQRGCDFVVCPRGQLFERQQLEPKYENEYEEAGW